MRSTAPCSARASCTDDTNHRTDSTHRAGIILQAIPRPIPRPAAFIEVPARDFTTAAARAIDDHRYRAKVRTCGTTAQAFPDDQTLANCLVTLAQARLAFKCTAGLHHAVRHRAAGAGLEHHGFLNVLLAVAAALDDASREQVAAELTDRDAARVAAKLTNLDAETISAVRSLFTSFGTCSTGEPVNDLVTLGLAAKP